MGQPTSIVVQDAGDSVWLRQAGSATWTTLGLRLGTSLTRSLARRFWSGGPTGLLAADFQRSLVETRSRISPLAGQSDPKRQSPFHAEHPWLGYYRETFLHIPFLIADHLNTDQDFAGAQRWYHTIFDPTAADGNAWRNRELAEPDNQTTTLRDLLIDSAALDAYRTNPFSPHAIARTRMSAYAKSIVMKYVDNLLDWGDSLFTQFTMESVNEAEMLYVMARDILGPRPAMLGPCGTDAKTRTYGEIRKGLTDVSDFLVELETPSAPTPIAATEPPSQLVIPLRTVEYAQALTAAPAVAPPLPLDAGPAAAGAPGVPGVPPRPPEGDVPVTFDGSGIAQTPVALSQLSASHMVWTSTGGTSLSTLDGGIGGGAPAGWRPHGDRGRLAGRGRCPGAGVTDYVRGYGPGSVGIRSGHPLEPFAEFTDTYDVGLLGIKYGPGDVFARSGDPLDRRGFDHYRFHPVEVVPPKDTVFCIPPNKELLGYWDRVEDRLPRSATAWTSPARAAARAVRTRARPAHARAHDGGGPHPRRRPRPDRRPATRLPLHATSSTRRNSTWRTVQNFGGQLLAALEKGDAEELDHLRTVHEQNLLTLRRKLAQLEIDAAEDTLESLRLQREAVEYRRQHFVALREAGTLPQERKQQDLQREASQFRTAASIAQAVASILTIIPDFGAPTAMKFGGSQLGAAGRAVGEGLGAHAGVPRHRRRDGRRRGAPCGGATRSGSTRRRARAASSRNSTSSITAAEIRRDIAVHSLEVHERTIEQAEEMFEFFRDRFTSVDRYRLLVKDLRRLHKVAFDSALRLAQLAEQAYRAERQDDGSTDDDDLLAGGYWDAQNAGLLAGRQTARRPAAARAPVRRAQHAQARDRAELLAGAARPRRARRAPPHRRVLVLHPGVVLRPLLPRAVPAADQGRPPDHAVRHRAVHERRRHAAPDREQASGLTAPPNQIDPLAAATVVPIGHTVSIATSRAQLDARRVRVQLPRRAVHALRRRRRDQRLVAHAAEDAADLRLRHDQRRHRPPRLHRRPRLRARTPLGRRRRAGDAASGRHRRRAAARAPVQPARRAARRLPPAADQPSRAPRSTLTLDERYFSLFLAGRVARGAVRVDLHPGAAREPGWRRHRAGEESGAPGDGKVRHGDGGGASERGTAGRVARVRLRIGAAHAAGQRGSGPEIVGTYLIKIVTAGALGAPGDGNAMNPDALRDIVLRVGYRLAATGG